MIGEESRSTNLDTAWQQHAIWSETANHLKRGIDRARIAALTLGIVAAGLAVLATQVDSEAQSRWIALGAGAAAALVPFVQRRAGTDRVRDWTRARSASEGLKTEVYGFLAHGSAYARDDREARLGEKTWEIVETVADLQRSTAGVELGDEQAPVIQDLDGYIEQRVNDQIDYYRGTAFRYDKRAKQLRLIGDGLAAAAAILAVAAATFSNDGLAAWVPFVTTAGTSLIAYIAAARYDHLIIEYLRTALRLEHLRESRRDKGISQPEFIDACEAAISIENQAWMARWNDPGESSS